MHTSDFNYQLPEELIAQHPVAERTDSRLLVLDKSTNNIQDKRFCDLLEFLQPEDCLIFNDTRVIPARMHGQKSTGGKLEILIERVLNDYQALAHIRCSKSPKAGSQLLVHSNSNSDNYRLTVDGRRGELFEISADISNAGADTLSTILQRCGHMPLPPYIEREDTFDDSERYQTVYASKAGAVAAPTAGLHFDEALLNAIRHKGIATGFVTLHVGAGTFQPVRVDTIEQHVMHSEYLEVRAATVARCKLARKRGGRIIAVGTTSVRCLETASQSGELQTFQGETDIFIYPGYRFKSVDALITNFHLPESTLIMLVSAFAGRENTLAAYQHAIEQRYRFFSYGDAMLIR